MSDEIIENGDSHENNLSLQGPQVTLPVPHEQLVSFISGLLGKPQTIGKRFKGPFILNYDNLLSIYALIEQRVRRQNNAELTQFSASMNFDDNSFIRLNSLEDLKLHNEIKPLACISLTLSWIYLVDFPQKSDPEKQQIDITFTAPVKNKTGDKNVANVQFEEIFFSNRWNGIRFSIDHTERTWANDIFSLLDGNLQKYLEDEKKM